MEIEGQVAIVTGGASGLGAATVRHLAAQGARLAIFDLDRDRGEVLAREVSGLFCTCDIAEENDVAGAITAVKKALGQPRILVNCAGIGGGARIVGRDGPMALAAFERTVRVNLVGTFNMIRLVASDMSLSAPLPSGERGVIISTASVAAFEGQIGQAAYSASKAGIVGLTLPAAREFARFGIRVNAIAPGLFETPMVGDLPAETRAGLATAIPFPARLGAPQEFAQLAAAIIANTYLNGEVIRLDGALRMGPK